MKNFKIICFLLVSLFAFNANAQTDKATTAKIVAQKNYVFVATSVIPLNSADVNRVLSQMSGGASSNINLTGDNYDLHISADSIIAYLPYYGRSYSAPIGKDESGYKFTAKDFTYAIKKVKRGWDIEINTKDVKDNVRMSLSIGENGYASLSVMSNNKQSITYNGYLSEPKMEKSK